LENVNLVDLPAYADTLCKDIMRGYEKRFVEREKNIKRASDDLAVVSNRLEISIRNAWGSLDKTTSEQGVRLAQTIREAAQRISKQDIQSDYSSSEIFHTTAVEVSDTIILAIRKHVPKLHKALKTDIALLNSSITKLEAAINTFGIALDESPGGAVESLKADIRTLLEKQDTLNELRRERQKIHELTIMSLDAEKSLLKEEEVLLSHEEFRCLLQLQDALQSKNEAIEQLIQPLFKALKKYERMLSDDDKSFGRQVLTRLINNPQITVAETDSHSLLHVFTALEGALTQGELGIEERKRKRAEEVITAITQGELDRLRGEYIAIQENVRNTTEKLNTTGLLRKKEDLLKSLEGTRFRTAQLNAQLAENEKRIEDVIKIISKEKLLIEKESTRLSGKPFAIRTEN
jgi:hypothetical protein